MNQKEVQVIGCINTLREANKLLKNITKEKFEEDQILLSDINDMIRSVNEELIGHEFLEGNKAAEKVMEIDDEKNNLESYEQEYKKWEEIMFDVLGHLNTCSCCVDKEFYKIIFYIKHTEYSVILQKAILNINNIKSNNPNKCSEYESYYALYRNFYGGIIVDKNYYKVLENRICLLKNNLSDFVWLYENLSDVRSKKVLAALVKNWLTFDEEGLVNAKEYNYADYFDLDIIKCDKEEVFVDLGAYTGDSALSYINTYEKYKKIYCYEITPENFEKTKYRLNEYENIVLKNKGVGAENCTMYINKIGVTGAANQIDTQGEDPIDIVKLDDDISDKITFIKMDIEGSEYDALLGSKNHIMEEHPKLAISVYHSNEDLIRIPKLIKEFNKDYKLYMRYNGNLTIPVDYTILAV